MTRLKRWESPRREGRNDKGKGGSARQRQLRKKFQTLRQKLQDRSDDQQPGKPDSRSIRNKTIKNREGEAKCFPLFLALSNYSESVVII